MKLVPVLVLWAAAAVQSHAANPTSEPPNEDRKQLGYLATVSSRQIADSPWGLQAGGGGRLDLMERMGQVGVKWTRIVVDWGPLEPRSGDYEFGSVDSAVDAAAKAGIHAFVCMTGGNKLYSKPIPNPDPNWRLIYGVKPAPPILDEAATAAWLRMVDQLVKHLRDRVSYWEIWNEPNHYAYWGAPPDAAAYGRLVRVTAAGIRNLQPGAKIIAGAVAGISDPKFVQGFLQQDRERAVDIVSFHNYSNLPEERMYFADDLWAVLRAHNPSIRLWQGECGYPSASDTKDFRGTSPWGETVQAKWLLRQAFIDTYFMHADVSNYFLLWDTGHRSDIQARPNLKPIDQVLGFPAESSGRRVRGVGVNEKCLLNNPDLKPKTGFYAYQNLCALFQNGYAPVPSDGRRAVTVTAEGQFAGIGGHDDAYPSVPLVAVYRRESGEALIAYWVPWQPQEYTPDPARITLRVPEVKMKDPVLVNLLDGAVYSISGARDPSVFADLPLLDFPLAIVEHATLRIVDHATAPPGKSVPSLAVKPAPDL